MKTINYSNVYRILQWVIALSPLFILVTKILRPTWLNKNNMAEIIQSYISNENISLSRDKIIILANNKKSNVELAYL
ncbi:hypothetical protein ACVWYG_002691 [Pedobacter sp. UYEF25]